MIRAGVLRWIVLAGALFWTACVASAAEPAGATTATLDRVEFLMPLEGFGVQAHRYRISARLTFSAPVTGRIVKATVNDAEVFTAEQRPPQPLIDTFDAGRQHVGGEALDGAREAYVQFYRDWKTGEQYVVGVTVRTDDGQAISCQSQPATAPAGGAIEVPLPRFKVLKLTETAALARKGWPVIAPVLLDAAELGNPETDMALVLCDVRARTYAQVPFQVLSITEPAYVAENAGKAQDQPGARLVELCFLADLDARGQAAYLLYYGRPGAAVQKPAVTGPQLQYRADPEGLFVDTGPAAFRFDPASGQLLSYVPKLAGVSEEMRFVQKVPRPVHWNPDVWAPPSPWGHTSDWGQGGAARPDLSTAQGPICLRTVRTGTMPNSNGVRASVTYTLFAGMPFMLESSYVEFTAPTRVRAVRSNELVFSRGLHTHALWMDETGAVSTRPCYDPAEPRRFFGHVARMGPDVPWLALFHAERGYGIGTVNLSRFSAAPAGGSTQDAGAYYYFLDYSEWGTGENFDMNFAYLCRAYFYGDAIIPKGAVYGEHSAVLVFKLDEGGDTFASVKRWADLLRAPAPKLEVLEGSSPQ